METYDLDNFMRDQKKVLQREKKEKDENSRGENMQQPSETKKVLI